MCMHIPSYIYIYVYMYICIVSKKKSGKYHGERNMKEAPGLFQKSTKILRVHETRTFFFENSRVPCIILDIPV